MESNQLTAYCCCCCYCWLRWKHRLGNIALALVVAQASCISELLPMCCSNLDVKGKEAFTVFEHYNFTGFCTFHLMYWWHFVTKTFRFRFWCYSKNITEVTRIMPQSWSTTFPRHQKKERMRNRQRQKKKKPHMKPPANKERRTSTEYTFRIFHKYSQTSMAWTPFGPWKFVPDIGSSMSHWGLVMRPSQKANDNNFGKSFGSSTQLWYVECTH